jgi:hypothetical protein
MLHVCRTYDLRTYVCQTFGEEIGGFDPRRFSVRTALNCRLCVRRSMLSLETNMKLSELIVLAGLALGLCVSATSAQAETVAEIPGLYPDNILALPAELFNMLSDLPIAQSDVKFVWVEINENNLENIVRQMADAKIPDEFAGGSFEVIWHADCRFSIDATIVVPRRDPAANFSDDEMLVARLVIAMVIQHDMISANSRSQMIRLSAQENCADRASVFEREQLITEGWIDGINRVDYQRLAGPMVSIFSEAGD